MSTVLIFTSFPFMICLLVPPFLLQASSCSSSSSSHFLTHPWRYDSSHLLAPIVLSELLTTSASISRLSLKHITSLPWNGSYHPHNSGAHTERADPTSLNLCSELRWKRPRTRQKAVFWEGMIIWSKEEDKCKLERKMWISQCHCANPSMRERWDRFWLFRRSAIMASGPMMGHIFSASLHVNQHVLRLGSPQWGLKIGFTCVYRIWQFFKFKLILWNIALTGNIIWGGCCSMSQSAGQLDTLLITWHASVWLSANAQNCNEKEQIHQLNIVLAEMSCMVCFQCSQRDVWIKRSILR